MRALRCIVKTTACRIRSNPDPNIYVLKISQNSHSERNRTAKFTTTESLAPCLTDAYLQYNRNSISQYFLKCIFKFLKIAGARLAY